MAFENKPRLAGKTALVTRGTRGIGFAVVKAFLAQGSRVAFSGTSAKTVEQARSDIGEGERCAGFVAELSAPDAAPQLVEAAVQRFGGVDVLVNNAGVVSTAGVWDVTA
jgi:NAD(P)-dependent dehydrogenase (short-subunit alcohol dehydrogenase family)